MPRRNGGACVGGHRRACRVQRCLTLAAHRLLRSLLSLSLRGLGRWWLEWAIGAAWEHCSEEAWCGGLRGSGMRRHSGVTRFYNHRSAGRLQRCLTSRL